MIDSYWDLYVAYIDKCVRDNWANDIDPHHYEMEWNHWLPKACFPDLPLGQWLTLKQHAIASALQTLATGKNCLCAWHKKYLPKYLLLKAWPIYRQMGRENGMKVMAEKKGIHSLNEEERKQQSSKAGTVAKAMGVGVHALTVQERRDYGKLGGHIGGLIGGQIAKEKRLGFLSPEYLYSEEAKEVKRKACLNMNSQVWESTVDGYRSTASNVSRHNRKNGWDPLDRIRIS